jgi:hypothetical protein
MVFGIKIIKILCKQKHMVNMAGNTEDIDEYKNMRMSKETFNMLLEKV